MTLTQVLGDMAGVFAIQTVVRKGCVQIANRSNESRSGVDNESQGTRGSCD